METPIRFPTPEVPSPPAARAMLALALVVTLGTALASHASHAAVDTAVQVTNGAVDAIVADGTTLFVGGAITRIGPSTGGGVPIATSTFAPNPGYPRVTGTVTAAAADGAGGWYIAGTFTAVGGVPRQNLAHITAANGIDGWSPSVDAQVLALVVTTADVIIGGTFTTVNGSARPRLARIARANGQLAPWAPVPSDRVTALATNGATLYVAGAFSAIASTPRAGLAAFALSGNALTAWDPAATAIAAPVQVNAVVLGNGVVYVGGNFHHIGGRDRVGAAALLPGTAAATKWDPSSAFPFEVTCLQPIGDRVILGTDFTAPGGLVAVDTVSGAGFPHWLPSLSPPPGAPARFHAFAALEGRIAVAGSFIANARGPGLFTGNLAVFDTAGTLPLVGPEPPGPVWALAAQSGSLYVGGQFTSLGPATCRNLVAIDALTGAPSSWAPDAAHTSLDGGLGRVGALATDASRVYAAVTFVDPILGISRSEVRAFSRTNATLVWQADCDHVVNALATSAGIVYAGGSFTSLAGAKVNLAALDAATGALQPWAPAPNGEVHALLAAPGALVVGGEFTSCGGQPRSRLAQVGYANGTATSWDPGADNTVWALARAGTTLFLGGEFAAAGGQARARVAAVDLGASAALPWNPGANGTVGALATDGTSVYLGGSFSLCAGVPSTRFAALGAGTGAVLAWGASANAPVDALAIANARAFLGGQFNVVDGEPLSGLASAFAPSSLAVDPPPSEATARLAVGPSPMRHQGEVRFTLERDAAVWLRVFDVTGRVVRTLIGGERRAAGPQRVVLDRAGLAPGIYHVQLAHDSGTTAARFVVMP
jgi:hypothetical protein